MSRYSPWHNHKYVQDPRYKGCAICSHPRKAPHHTKKRRKNGIGNVLKRSKWKIFGE